MKTPAAKPSLATLLVAKKARRLKQAPALPASRSNAALPQQNRRVLAQHYRAKYGVK